MFQKCLGVVNDANLAVVAEHLGSGLTEDVPLDLDAGALKVVVGLVEDGALVEANCGGVSLSGSADDAVDTRPQGRAQAHAAGLAAGEQLEVSALGAKRVEAELGLGDLNCDGLAVEARVVHGNNSVAAHRDDPGGAIRQALEND